MWFCSWIALILESWNSPSPSPSSPRSAQLPSCRSCNFGTRAWGTTLTGDSVEKHWPGILCNHQKGDGIHPFQSISWVSFCQKYRQQFCQLPYIYQFAAHSLYTTCQAVVIDGWFIWAKYLLWFQQQVQSQRITQISTLTERWLSMAFSLQDSQDTLNWRAGANLRHLGSVCWQPTTALGGNNVDFRLQGWMSWVCMLATYGLGLTWGILGLYVGNLLLHLPPLWALNCRAAANLRHLGSVCWPTQGRVSNCYLWSMHFH